MLKRILLCMMAAFLFLCAPVYAEGNKNLLMNPGFEQLDEAGMPIGWYTDAYINRSGVTLYRMTTDAKSGGYAAVVDNSDMNDARFAQVVKVEPNTMYRLSGWIRADGILDAGKGANLSVEGVHAMSERLYDTDGEWVYVETFGLTDDDQTEVTIFARVGGYSGESVGTAAFDDLSLEVMRDDLPVGEYAQAWFVEPVQVIEPTPVAETEEAEPFWPWLIVIACVYAAAALWLMQYLQLDRREMALREAATRVAKFSPVPLFLLVGLGAAALIRLIIALQVEGYQVDVNCFTAWGNTMSSVGPAMFYQSAGWCDYTPGYIYVMGLNGMVAEALNGLVNPAFVHKIIPMLCDLLGACVVYRLSVEHECTREQSGLLALLISFNPAVILNSAAWCQIDSVLCVGLMLVAYLALHRRWKLVLPLYVLCILIKPQALMLGFLGLAALVMEWIRKPGSRKEMMTGVVISVLVALLVIIPFCPNQESPFWLFNLYKKTLASYPHATLNTANLYYLAGANWDGIENAADPAVCVFFVIFALAAAVYTALRQRKRIRQYWAFEPVIFAAYAVIYAGLAIAGCTWTNVGVVAMSMAFAIVLPMFIRSGKLENLPLCGAVIFLLLYAFGIKMHERYIFPALFLLGMAYAIRRDRRIMGLLVVSSCVLFINEGIILDNSIRLGSSMGHLNADTVALANLLSLLNVTCAAFSAWVCHRICVEDSAIRLCKKFETNNRSLPEYAASPCTPLTFESDAKLRISRLDVLLMVIVTLVYSIVALTTLGSTKAPQKPWKSSAYGEYVYIDLGRHYDDFSMMYFAQVSYHDFAVAVSDDVDGNGWSEEYPAEMREGMCFSWRYLDPSYMSNGTATFVNAASFDDVQKLSGRFVRINPKQTGLILNEIIFKDAEGNIIPDVMVMGRINGNEASPMYSDPEHLLDEQDTLDGEPSWWNSTYFDEIYHARTAYELLNNTAVYEWTHPPLGKIIMSWFVGLFGMTPFGWRFAGALCGILMLPSMYLLVKQLTKRTDLSFVAMMLMTLDCMHFTQTRIATIDSYAVLFIMLSYFFMLRFMQRDIVLEDVKKLLPDLALSGFFMGCGVASKWIGVYAGIGLGVLYFWICIRHLRMGSMAASMLNKDTDYSEEHRAVLEQRAQCSVKRVLVLCLWCLLFFVTVPLAIYLLSYADRFADRNYASLLEFLKAVYNENFAEYGSMLWYHSQPGMGMDHPFHSPWYEWPLMATPMYYASASFKPEGMTYAIFCFGNPWVWLVGLLGIGLTVYRWYAGHRYVLAGKDGTFHAYRGEWDVTPAFILIGLLAQLLPWVLVPRGTYIYHYFASVPFLILGTVVLFQYITTRWPRAGKWMVGVYLLLCLIWFVLLFPYASGLMTPNAWMDFIRDYPYINTMDGYWQSDFLVNLNNFLEKIPIFPHVYHH